MKGTWTFLAALGLSAALAWAADPPAVSDKTKQHIGGDKVVKLIQAIDKVEAFRVGSVDNTKNAVETVGSRVIMGKGKEMPKEFAPKVIAALLAEDTYFKADSKGTATGVAFRAMTPDGGVVEVSFCVSKGNLFLLVKDASGKVLKSGDCRGFRDDPRAPMRLLAAEAFPDDPTVQKYKPKGDPVAPANVPKVDPAKRGAADPLQGVAPLEALHTGMKFADTPSWLPGEKVVLFTDLLAGKLYQLGEKGLPTVRRDGPSRGRVAPSGEFIGHVGTDLVQWRASAAPQALVTGLRNSREGFHEGALNDLVVSRKGFVYFTTLKDVEKETPDKKGRLTVVEIATKGTRVAFEGEREPLLANPNGVALSPDEKFLYVVISSYANRKNSCIRRFPVQDNGALDVKAGLESVFAAAPACDGIAADEHGNVWFTQGDKLRICAADGKELGTLKVPGGSATNLCFGGDDRRTLYVTTRTTLLRTRVNVPGYVPASTPSR